MGIITKGYVYRIHGNALYGRNRKVKWFSERVLPFSENERPDAEVRAAADLVLASLKIKSGTYKVTCDPIERDDQGDGVVWQRFVLFSERTVFQGTI